MIWFVLIISQSFWIWLWIHTMAKQFWFLLIILMWRRRMRRSRWRRRSSHRRRCCRWSCSLSDDCVVKHFNLSEQFDVNVSLDIMRLFLIILYLLCPPILLLLLGPVASPFDPENILWYPLTVFVDIIAQSPHSFQLIFTCFNVLSACVCV